MSFFTRKISILAMGTAAGAVMGVLHGNVLEDVFPSPDSRWPLDEEVGPNGYIPYSAARMKQMYRDYFEGRPLSSPRRSCSTVEAQEEQSTALLAEGITKDQDEEEGVYIRKDIPKTLRARFLSYVQEEKETNSRVLYLEDFISCLLMLPPRGSRSKQEEGAVLQRFPPHVQQRLRHFFNAIDMDKSGSINYGEFVVLFTMLSTQKKMFDLAFQMFDTDGNGKVSQVEFCRIINTLMVDPSVQVVLDDSDKNVISLSGQSGSAYRGRRNLKDNKLSFEVPSRFLQEFIWSDTVEHRSPPPGSSHGSRWFSSKASLYKRLRRLAEEDKKEANVSYDLFRYKMDFLRWELRAVEFGIFDKENTGKISLNEFRKILNCDIHHHHPQSGGAEEHHPTPPLYRRLFNFGKMVTPEELKKTQKGTITNETPQALPTSPSKPIDSNAPLVNWQFYQTIFDIIKDSDRTLPALELALRAEPPVKEEDLVQGAVPDDTRREERAASHQLLKETSAQGSSKEEKREARKTFEARRRPTALTWSQFAQVLHAVDGLPKMNQKEQALFFELFDADRSGTITPSEFQQLCELKRSFFATYLPRFDEPRRNTVQQFFYCMQQLE